MNDIKSDSVENELENLREIVLVFKCVVDNCPVPIFIKNEDAKFYFFNKAYEKYFNVNGKNL